MNKICQTFQERWIVCTPLSANVFVTLATQRHLEYYCKALLETPCITSGTYSELQLSQIKLCVFSYIMTV
jgi:hypothetical protein